MDHPILQILMRYLHIVSAVMAVGGIAFLAFCLSPVMRLLDDGFSESWMKRVRERFHKVMWISIGGLIVSGIYNWVLSASIYKAMGAKGNALIGIKVLLAIIIFVMAWVGSLGVVKPKVVQMVNIHLAAVVILLGAVLRYFRLEYIQSLAGWG